MKALPRLQLKMGVLFQKSTWVNNISCRKAIPVPKLKLQPGLELLETPLTLRENTLLCQCCHCQNTGCNAGLDQRRGNQLGKD